MELLERHVPLHERIALYSVADVAVVTATRDGMNLVPYEYVICRQGPSKEQQGAAARGATADSVSALLPSDPQRKSSILVVSEFVGCSPSLSGALRVNPWSVDSVYDGIYAALKMPLQERQLRHDKHWKYVSTHTASFWAKSYFADLCKTTAGHGKMRSYGLGLGLDTFRMVALDANFRKLEVVRCLEAYMRAERRCILTDYDGTLVNYSSISHAPPATVVSVLENLSQDERNTVYIVSGRTRAELEEWFARCPRLGLAAENGFFVRAPGSTEWVHAQPGADLGWMEVAGPILASYQDQTDGSFVEGKESSLVWHYRDADPDFGAWQAKELLDHLEDVLASEPAEVVTGPLCVEVKPAGISKGRAVDGLLKRGQGGQPFDFVLCIGDDRSDGQMFNAVKSAPVGPLPGAAAPAAAAAALAGRPHLLGSAASSSHPAEALPQVYPCTVGQKPSRASYYLNDTQEVLDTLQRLTSANEMGQSATASLQDNLALLAPSVGQLDIGSPKGKDRFVARAER